MTTDFGADQESSNQEPSKAGVLALIQRLEWIVAILLSAVVLFLLVARATHTGPLWRDEADSVQSAQMSFGEMLHDVQYSSFPILFPLVVRAHTTLFGASDTSLRCFGMAAGILILAASWLTIRRLTEKAPLLLPVIIGLNANFLIAGMSLRGYGLGSLMVLLAFALTVRLLVNPTVITLVSVFVADLVSTQCLFLNAPLVLAMTIAAIGAFLVRREVKWIWLLTGIVVICGLSHIFYLLEFRSSLGGWEKIIQVPVSFGLMWQYFFAAWGDISPGVSTIWLGLIVVSLAGVLWRLATFRSNHRAHERDVLFFGILMISLSIIASYAFVWVLQRSPEQRFFLPLTMVVAATVDLLWANFPLWLRAARIGLVTLATVTLPFSIWGNIIQAESNAETVARILEQNAGPTDLIVVSPWTYGVSFNWYYHGAARWITVPEISDHRIHRYDLLLKKMVSVSPLADVKEKIATTLKSGNRLWFAGQAELPAPGEAPLQLSPAPDPRFGWLGVAYRKAWSQEIGLFLWRHVERTNQTPLRTEQLVSARENIALYMLEGWKN